MKLLMLTLVVCAVGQGLAGKAYPQVSQEYVTMLFQEINPNIEWDKTNYVVDLSGYHAQCEFVEVQGVSYESTRTRDGEIITVIQGGGPGQEAHVNAVNSYIPPLMESWPQLYADHIRKAEKFGCSVQPGCQGKISIACLFAPSILSAAEEPADEPLIEGRPEWKPHPTARAFTKEQYSLAEEITGKTWDRDHFLENLSGYDITCDEMLANKGTYTKADVIASDRGQKVKGVYGYSENRGNTEEALVLILKNLEKPSGSGLVGCSLLADCMKGTQMYVLSSCIFKM